MNRRGFLFNAASAVLALAGKAPARASPPRHSGAVTLFLCGDVMTGRGIDQALPHPSDSRIHERTLKSALGYVQLAEAANGPILDWGHSSLSETLATLRKAGLKTAGAGRDIEEAEAPAILELDGERRVLVLSFGSVTAGIPRQWAATRGTPGVNLFPNLSGGTIRHIARKVEALKQPGDVVVASIHWGSNWGFHIPREQRTFAHKLHRRGIRGRGAWPLVAPCQGNRGLQRKANPLRMR